MKAMKVAAHGAPVGIAVTSVEATNRDSRPAPATVSAAPAWAGLVLLAQLVHAIRVAAAGDALLAPSVTRRLIARFAPNPPLAIPGLPTDLTSRETEVLSLLAEGLSNAETPTGWSSARRP